MSYQDKQAGAAAVKIWGTGEPRREFLCVDDMAAACLHVCDGIIEPGSSQ
jgi:GDP-L-fucose synthase